MDCYQVSESDMCPICMEALSSEDALLSKCGHPVHRSCAQASVRAGNYTCPICRAPYTELAAGECDRAFLKFSAMLRMKIPPTAVRQRMAAAGITPVQIDTFFTGGCMHNEDDLAIAAEVHQRMLDGQSLQPYLTMLRVGLLEAAVREKMRAAGFSQEAISLFFNDKSTAELIVTADK